MADNEITIRVIASRDDADVYYTGNPRHVAEVMAYVAGIQHRIPESDKVLIERERAVTEGQKIVSSVKISHHKLQWWLACFCSIVAIVFLFVSCQPKPIQQGGQVEQRF